MALKDFIKKKKEEALSDEFIVEKYESIKEQYPEKGDNWHVRITAEELGIHKGMIEEILTEYYSEQRGN